MGSTGRVQVLPRVPMEDGLVGPRHICQHEFARLGLSRTRLTCNDNRLVLLICDQLLERILCYHEEVRARVLNEDAWPGCCLSADLRAIVAHLLSILDGEDRQALVGVHADQDWSTDLRENIALLLESFLNVEED